MTMIVHTRADRIESAALRAAAVALGALPDHRGQFRVAQRYWHHRRPRHRLLRQRLVDGPELWLDLGDRTQAIAWMTRRYEADLVAELVRRLPPDGTFVDAGANVGLISFQVAHRRPGARIHAIEANPPAAAIWRRNRELNPCGHVELASCALGAEVGSVTLVAPEHDLGGGRVSTDGPGVTVPVTTLDRFCEERGIIAIDVLKLDVEGSEAAVLRGARGLLEARAIRTLVMECNDGYLEPQGLTRAGLIGQVTAHGLRVSGPADGLDVTFELAPEG